MNESLFQGLQSLLNGYCRENESGTPDSILAHYMLDCLVAFDRAVNRREKWYGRKQDEFGMPLIPQNAVTYE